MYVYIFMPVYMFNCIYVCNLALLQAQVQHSFIGVAKMLSENMHHQHRVECT